MGSGAISGAGWLVHQFGKPLTLNTSQRRERLLAEVRICLAAGSLIAVRFDPYLIHQNILQTHALLVAYLLYSLATLIVIRSRREVDSTVLLSVYMMDLFWPALLSLVTSGPGSYFFLLYVFALVAAAYRWGFRETLATAFFSVFFFTLVTVMASSTWRHYIHVPLFGLTLGSYITRAMNLMMLGGFLGFLAEKEKQLQTQTLTVGHILRKITPEFGLRETLNAVLRAMSDLFDVDHILVTLKEVDSDRGFFWEIKPSRENLKTFRFDEMGPPAIDRYFFEMHGQAWYFRRPRGEGAARSLILSHEGDYLRQVPGVPEAFLAEHDFKSIMAVSFMLGSEWCGRLFLFDPRGVMDCEAELQFLQALTREVAPAVYSVYLLRRLRSRTRAAERIRMANELHDGVIQSLSALEMRVSLLVRQIPAENSTLGKELREIQQILCQEIFNVREIMQQFRCWNISPQQLLNSVADLVDKFQRETGIKANFISESENVKLPPRVCREVALIVQEALINVRKHSGARNVLVKLSAERDLYKLIIEDDGKGFALPVQLSAVGVGAIQNGPRVLKDRVHSIHGELAIESFPGRGARLEIRFPQRAYG